MFKKRGPHPKDIQLFSNRGIELLKKALVDINWLLTRGYSVKASLKLICDHYRLVKRQRLALQKAACSDNDLSVRKDKQIKLEDVKSNRIWIDGFNLIITLETAVSGGIIITGCDNCFRDLSSIHGTYRKIKKTSDVINLAGTFLSENYKGRVFWLLDKPVSNSGRLKKIIEDTAARNKWNWMVELDVNPDKRLIEVKEPVVSADSVILNKCSSWINLAGDIIKERMKEAWIVDLNCNKRL